MGDGVVLVPDSREWHVPSGGALQAGDWMTSSPLVSLAAPLDCTFPHIRKDDQPIVVADVDMDEMGGVEVDTGDMSEPHPLKRERLAVHTVSAPKRMKPLDVEPRHVVEELVPNLE